MVVSVVSMGFPRVFLVSFWLLVVSNVVSVLQLVLVSTCSL